MKTHHYLFSILILTILLGGSCSPNKNQNNSESLSQEDTLKNNVNMEAIATMSAANSSGVTGQVTFRQTDNTTVLIEVELENISPGTHAIHLHEHGDCTAPDAKSAGGHWNPTGQPHGKRGEGEFHKGDITNLEVDSDKKISWSEHIIGWTIGGPDSTSILNKAVIIHASEDDFTSQPSGDAGPRIACGVIKLEKDN